MGNSCNQIPTLSNTAEIVKNESRFKLSPLQWSSLNPPLILISADQEITAFNENMINYVDLESVRFVDDHIYFWRLTDYTTLQKSPDPNVPEGYNSLAMYIKAGCKKFSDERDS